MRSQLRLLAGILLFASTAIAVAQNGPVLGLMSVSTISPARSDVKDIPFSAVVQEIIQRTDTSNFISRLSYGKIFRDVEGRTRYERIQDCPGQPCMKVQIIIDDPVSGRVVFMHPETKAAEICGRLTSSIFWSDRAGAGSGASLGVGGQGAGAEPVRAKADLPETLKAMQPGSGSSPDQHASEPQEGSKAPRFISEQLGEKDIEGFVASGTRKTLSPQEGVVGGDRPIATTEVWTSEDLQAKLITITETRFDRRTVRLIHIRLSDPEPQLFQIPGDYAVKELRPQPTYPDAER